MDMFYIIEAICEKLNKKFPQTNIYINNVPQNFKRPSFYVGIVDFDDSDLSNGILQRLSVYEVLYFPPLNSRGLAEKISQYSTYISMASVFESQSLETKDRFIKIQNKRGSLTETESNLIITFEYAFETSDISELDDLYELMQDLQIKYLF